MIYLGFLIQILVLFKVCKHLSSYQAKREHEEWKQKRLESLSRSRSL